MALTDANSEPPGWIKGAVWLLGLGLPLVAGGLVYLNDIQRASVAAQLAELSVRVSANDAKISGIAESLARSLEWADQHEVDANRYKDRIDRIQERLGAIASDATARPDPFTGTQGRELERRIDAMERMTDMVEHLKARCAELAEDQRATRAYYQSTVIPLIEQSNQIQMQRMQRESGR